MTAQYVRQKLALLIENLPEEIDPEQNLAELGLDSLRLISLVVMIEEESGKELEVSLLLLEKLNTIAKIQKAWEGISL